MRIALLGNGKTGSRVNRMAAQRGDVVTIFDSRNTPTTEKLQGHDVVVSFLPGDAFLGYVSTLIDSKIPVVSGSTGFQWPDGSKIIQQKVVDAETIWIQSGNFSLGNLALLPLISQIGAHPTLNDFKPFIQEWHHVHKQDTPSGTALLWNDAFGRQAEIRSHREGDTVGVHELTLSSDTETITIRHEVTDRDVFAQGALFLAEFIVRNQGVIRKGLYSMQELMDSYKHLH